MRAMEAAAQDTAGPTGARSPAGIEGLEGLGIWVINLDRAPQRLQRVREQLGRLGLPFTRRRTVDARALEPAQRAALDEATYRRRHGMAPVWGKPGCYLSHVAVMRAFLAGPWRAALVLEDDVLLHDTPPAVLRGLLAMQLPCDHVFDQGWRFGLKVRLVTPTPCTHDDRIASTIDGTPGQRCGRPSGHRGRRCRRASRRAAQVLLAPVPAGAPVAAAERDATTALQASSLSPRLARRECR